MPITDAGVRTVHWSRPMPPIDSETYGKFIDDDSSEFFGRGRPCAENTDTVSCFTGALRSGRVSVLASNAALACNISGGFCR